MEIFYRKEHLKRSGKRLLAILLCACMIGTMIPISAKAENGTTNTGLCEHHTEHTTECGYAEELACNHVHDEECGYIEASEGSPCTFVCDICENGTELGENNLSDETLTQTLEQTEGQLITTKPDRVVSSNILSDYNTGFEEADDAGNLYRWNDASWETNIPRIAYGEAAKPAADCGDYYVQANPASIGDKAQCQIGGAEIAALIKGGNTYEYSYYAKLAEGGTAGAVTLSVIGDWSTSAMMTPDKEVTLNDYEWQKVTGTFTLASDASSIIVVRFEGTAGVAYCIDDLRIGNTASLTDQSGTELTGNDWWAQSVTFTAPDGFTISDNLTGTYESFFTYDTQTSAEGATVTYYLKNSDGEIAEKTAIVHIDKTVPNWNGDNCGISIKENWWKSLLGNISFCMFYKETVNVKVCVSDSLSGVAAYYYYVDSTGGTVKTAEELDNISFTKYTGSVLGQNPSATVASLAPDGNYIVYAYAIDAARNRSAYVCSEGVVVDSTAPAISNIVAPSEESSTLTDTAAQISFTSSEAGTYFYVCMEKDSSESVPNSIDDFATSDTNDKGMLNWTAKDKVSSATMTADAGNVISLNGLKTNTEYTLYLVAVDLAGNSTETTVYSQSFTTCRTMPTVADADMPKISGTYGQTVADMTLTPGIAKVGNDTITGTWAVTDSGKTDTPSVGTTATYQVTFTPNTSYNGMYDTVIVAVKPTVNKRAITVTIDNKTKTYGEANPTFTYAITEGELVSGDDNTALDIILSCDAEESSPVKTNGYAITGTSSSANYKVTITQGTLTINKADAQITVDEGKDSYSKTFGDADFILSGISDTNTEANVQYAVTAGNDVVSVLNGTVTILKAGTAKITVSLPESTNYNAAASKTITVNVAKNSNYTVDDIYRSYLYSRNNAATIDLSGCLPAKCGTVTYGAPQVNGALYTDDGQPAVSSDGKLSYTVKLADSAGATGTIKITVTTDNYVDFTITVNVALTDKIPVSLKEDSTVTLQNSTLTYGQALSMLTFNSAVFVNDDGNEVAGSLTWKTPDDKPYAGTTSATWVFTPNDASYATVEGFGSITVKKATPNVTAAPTVEERTYNPNASLKDTDFAYGTVSVEGSWSWQSANIIPTVNNSGYVAVFTPKDSTNYEAVTRTITVTVSRATPHIETAPAAAAITYGDTLGESALTGGTVQYSDSDATAVSGSFAWNDSSVKPSVSDSDTTTYQVIFTPSDTVNYNTVETTVTLTVNKADDAPNMPSSTMNVANSCEKLSDVTLPTGWVWQDADKDIALTVGTAVTVTAVYNGADKGNYVNETVSVTITRSSCEHAAGEILYTGDGEQAPTCTEDGLGHRECTICHEVMESGIVVKAAHVFSSQWTIDKPATTTAEGSKSRHCTREGCDAKTDVTVIPRKSYGGGGSSGGSSGGGSSSGGIIVEVTTEKDSESKVTITTLPTEVKMENGTASATVKAGNVTEAIKQAADNTSAAVVLTVSEKDCNDADKVQLTMYKSDVQQILDKIDAELVVATAVADVTLSQDVLKKTVSAAGGQSIAIGLAKVTKPTEVQKAAAGENSYIVDVTISSKNEAITTFGGAALRIRLEVPEVLAGKDVAAIHIAEDGKTEKMPGKKVKKGTKEFYEFATTHLSTFALVDGSMLEEEIVVPEKGTLLTDSATKLVFKVTKSGKTGGTVSLVRTEDTKAKTITVPEEVTFDGITYKVTSIGAYAFRLNTNITKVVIGKNVTYIGYAAFSRCTNLKYLTIGENVTSIGKWAFYQCSGLTKLTIPAKVKKIGDHAFNGCSSIKTLTLGKNVTSIGAKAFFKCTGLTGVTIPSKVSVIDKFAFYGCNGLTTIKLNTTLLSDETVSERAFRGLPAGVVVSVPESKEEAYKTLLVKLGLSKKATIKSMP